MKKYISICGAAFLFCLNVSAQDAKPGKQFTLQGNINNPQLDSVSLEYISYLGKYVHDVVPVKNGAFQITGEINQPSFAQILFKNKNEVLSKRQAEVRKSLIYIETTDMLITEQADAHGDIQIKGSKAQSEWNELRAQTRTVQKNMDSVNNANPTHNTIGNKLTPYKAQMAKIDYAFYLSHPNSFVTADRIRYDLSFYSLDSVKRIYNGFNEDLKTSMSGKILAANIKSQEVGLPGTSAYPFAVKDRFGKDVSLAAYKGKYVLLDFWATWCAPCRASVPHLVSLYKKYQNKNFAMIGIGDDDTRVKEWEVAIDHDGSGSWPQVLRGMSMDMARKGTPNPRDISEQYGIRALPTKILVDPNGKIIGRFTGAGPDGSDPEMDKMLAEVLK